MAALAFHRARNTRRHRVRRRIMGTERETEDVTPVIEFTKEVIAAPRVELGYGRLYAGPSHHRRGAKTPVGSSRAQTIARPGLITMPAVMINEAQLGSLFHARCPRRTDGTHVFFTTCLLKRCRTAPRSAVGSGRGSV